MSMDVYKVIKEIDTQNVIEIIAPCMDDFLYIFDLQKDTMKISQSAVGRFMIPDRFLNNASEEVLHATYEEDRDACQAYAKCHRRKGKDSQSALPLA